MDENDEKKEVEEDKKDVKSPPIETGAERRKRKRVEKEIEEQLKGKSNIELKQVNPPDENTSTNKKTKDDKNQTKRRSRKKKQGNQRRLTKTNKSEVAVKDEEDPELTELKGKLQAL